MLIATTTTLAALASFTPGGGTTAEPEAGATPPPATSVAATALAWGAPTAASARSADDGSAAAEMARKLQNPLANIKAVMTDNQIGFNTGLDEGTSYGFQLQPVYAIDMPERGFTFIPRAVIPFMGLEPGTNAPPIATPPDASSRVWGLGDTSLQAFFAPHSDSEWKWGVGPQLSLPTATDSRLRGADFGAGIAGVVTGSFTPDLSFAAIVGNMWAFDGSFNTGMVQPMLFYNIDALPGAYVGYNAPITFDWEATSRNSWTFPLGAAVGRTLDLGDGNGLDLNIGPYYNVARPEGAADWVVRFGVTWLLP